MTDAETERKAIVAWLRAGIWTAEDPPFRMSEDAAQYAEYFADDIEGGAHLNPETNHAG